MRREMEMKPLSYKNRYQSPLYRVAFIAVLLCGGVVVLPIVSTQETVPVDATHPQQQIKNSSVVSESSSSSATGFSNNDDLTLSEEQPNLRTELVPSFDDLSSSTTAEDTSSLRIVSADSDILEPATVAASATSANATMTTTTTAATAAFTNDDNELNRDADPITYNTSTSPVQEGPFIDLLGPQLLSLEMIDPSHAQLEAHYTNEALMNKKVVGLYFSADWCGPCRQFTPELMKFYERINSRKGRKNEFEIVWISRCRDVNSYGQYFTQMKWLALPPEDAMGERGRKLNDLYKVKGIPTLVLLDELGSVITTDARNKIPADKAGIGFPWRNPIANVYLSLVPKTIRLMLKSYIHGIKNHAIQRLKRILGFVPRAHQQQALPPLIA